MAKITGNDISHHQGDINFDVYRNNSFFLIMKATEGTSFTDPKLKRNQSEARRVGLPLGYYHFARPDANSNAENEAVYFLNVIGSLQEGEVLVLDYEPNWNGDAVAWCKKWLDAVFARTGCRPLIYLNESQVRGFNWKPVVDGGYGLWIAKYTYDPNKNTYNKGIWPFAAMQQWTNRQQVPGIAGNVDGNVFFGDQATFKKYGYKPPAAPPPVTDYKKLYDEEVEKHKETTKHLAEANDRISDLLGKIERAKQSLA